MFFSAIAVFLVSFSVYLLTLCPTVYTGDSGELITACYSLGVAHPPGYPLYYILGKLFTFIPLGSVAFRVNLLSAFSASLACVVLYFIIVEFIRILNPEASFAHRFLPAFSASLIFAFSDTFWSQAVIADARTLHVFTIALTFLVLLYWTQNKKDKYLYWFAFLYGLSITCHQLALFFWLGFLIMLLSNWTGSLAKPKVWIIMSILFLAGFSAYLYIPLRSHFDPVINWGKVHDWESFIRFLFRRQYDGADVPSNYTLWDVFIFFKPDLYSLKQLPAFLTRDLSFIWPLAAIGLIPLALKARRYLLAILSIILLGVLRVWVPLAQNERMLSIGRVYLLAGYLCIALLLGLGFFYLLEIAQRRTRKAIYYLLVITISLSVSIPLGLNFSKNDLSRNFVAYNYGRNVLSTLDKDAILLASGDNDLFILSYMTNVEHMRPDVRIYDDLSGDVFKRTRFCADLSVRGQNKLIGFLLDKSKRPLYLTFDHPFIDNIRYDLDLVGVVYKVLRDNEKIPLPVKQRCWLGYNTDGVFDAREKSKSCFMQELIASYHIQYGDYLLLKKDQRGFLFHQKALEIVPDGRGITQYLLKFYIKHGMFKEAEKVLAGGVRAFPQDAGLLYNFGVFYGRSGQYKKAILCWEKALQANPDYKKAKDYIALAKELMQKNQSVK